MTAALVLTGLATVTGMFPNPGGALGRGSSDARHQAFDTPAVPGGGTGTGSPGGTQRTRPTQSAQPTRPAVTPRPAAPGHVQPGRAQPAMVTVPRSGEGRYTVATGRAAPPQRRKGRVIRYLVEVERGLPFERAAFAAEVHRILNDPRGWGHGDGPRFRRVARGPVAFRVALSSPALTDRECLPLRTAGRLSCWNGRRSVINARRWGRGAPTYGRDLASYREYLINHEVGHALGRGHRDCPRRGRPAPVMTQQTKSLYGCRPNPWPNP